MAGKTPAKRIRWSKEAIRAELQKLDRITGLKGAELTVKLYAAPEPLGYFAYKDPARMTFGFSATRFEDPHFTEAEALDVIRHEYAHFMEVRLFGESTDHGPNWRRCCIKVGARPDQFYRESFHEAARQQERERVRRTRVDGFAVGKAIRHPRFGVGIIEAMEQQKLITKLSIRFPDGLRQLDIDWVRKNCAIVRQDELHAERG